METVWLFLQDNAPEYSAHKQSELDFLADCLCGWENDKTLVASVKQQLLAMPPGFIQRIQGKRVVRVYK